MLYFKTKNQSTYLGKLIFNKYNLITELSYD